MRCRGRQGQAQTSGRYRRDQVRVAVATLTRLRLVLDSEAPGQAAAMYTRPAPGELSRCGVKHENGLQGLVYLNSWCDGYSCLLVDYI